MYLAAILALMVVLPIASVVVEWMAGEGSDLLFIVGKWFVFWAVGIRLLAAGIRQVMQPSFTAVQIFRITDPAAEKLVSEIGFGNLSMGLVAALTLLAPGWLVPAGLAGGLYLALAGIKHLANNERTREENIAMVSDLGVAVVLAVALGARLL
jgi:hypothetical protein